jgi:hypothetical protein
MLCVAMILVASPVVVADPAPGVPVPGFSGRSGVTKERIIVIGCARPDAPEPVPAAIHEAHAVGVRPSAADQKRLRELMLEGVSDWMPKEPRTKEELLKGLPPKYRALVKEYFESLERAQKEKK